jgi:hypothetical protein
VIKKEVEKILKYKDNISADVKYENKSGTSNINGDWNNFRIIQTNLSNVPGKHEIKELQKTAVLDTALILRKVLM